MKIELTQDKYTVVDDKNFAWLNQYKWYADVYHVARNITVIGQEKHKNIKRKQKKILIHKLIMEKILGRKLEPEEQIDHINADIFDNRECNLRMCDHSQNQANRKTTIGTSQYKGVSWHKKSRKWQTSIKFNKKRIWLGCFNNEINAAKSYNEAALKYFGEFARLNII